MVHQDTNDHRRARRHQLKNLHSKKIDEHNIGFKLLSNMDWKMGQGIGKKRSGNSDYVKISRSAFRISTSSNIEESNSSVVNIGGHGIGYSNKGDDDYPIVDESLVRTSIFSGMLANLQKQAQSNGGFIIFNKKSSSSNSDDDEHTNKSESKKNKKPTSNGKDKSYNYSSVETSEDFNITKSINGSKYIISGHKHSKLVNAKIGNEYTEQDLSGIFHEVKKRKRDENEENNEIKKIKESKQSKSNEMSVYPVSIADYFRQKALSQRKIVY